MISPKKVKYNDFCSKDFSQFTLLTDLAFESDQGEVSSYLNREAVASESYHGEFKRVYGYKYTESLSPKLTFIKEGFNDFSLEEVRQVLTWLTSKKTASFLDVYDDIDSEAIAYSILGGFTDIQMYKRGNNRTIAIVATFESVHPYALSQLQTITKNPTDDKIEIKISSDEIEKAIYPRITINKYSGGDITITNTYADRNRQSQISELNLKNNSDGEKIVVDGANRVIYSSNTTRIFGEDFVGWTWLELYNGTNTITVTGNCTVTFEYREPRKIGEF